MKIVEVSVGRPVFTIVMIMALVVFGVWSYPRVGVDMFPEIEFPVVTVVTVYPGADPETVEAKVVDPLEEAINSVSGIEELRSTSSEGAGVIVVRFDLERDADQAVQDVRDKVAGVVGALPEDALAPIVQKFDIGAAPIMSVVVSGPLDTRALTDLADNHIKERLQTLEGVGNIAVVGGQLREFHINVDPVALKAFSLTVDDVARAIGSQNIEVPGGRLTQGDQEFVIKTRGEVHTAEELADIVVGSPDGRPVRVAEVATVLDTEEEKRSHAALNRSAAISLTIQKQSGANTVAVAAKVREELEKLRAELAPQQITLTVPVDSSTFIEESIGDVKFDLVFGAVLAILIIMLFLRDWRATLISAMALPTSVIATVAFINVMGFTLNMMTMLALTLSIGILIDDAIVVIENIHRHLEMGKTPRQAALDGTSEIGLAVLAITMSIIAVFVPVATMKGIMGRFFFQFGMTVAFAVAVSLFVAFTLTPMLSSLLLAESHGEPGRVSRWIDGLLTGIEQVYENLVSWALRHSVITGLVAVASFVGAMSLFGLIPFEFVPEDDRGELNVFLELPSGSKLEKTMAVVDEVTRDIEAVPGITMTFATIGGTQQGDVHKAVINVKLLPTEERDFTQAEAAAFLRKMLAARPELNPAVEAVRSIGGGATRTGAVQYLLLGRDFDAINAEADDLVAELEKIDGFVDLDKSSRSGKPEIQVSVNRVRAADLGVPVSTIALAIRTLYAGDTISQIATDGDRYDVRIRLLERFRQNPTDLLNLTVRSTTGDLVPMSQLVQIKEGTGATQIERFNRQRQVTVLANLDGITLGEAMAHIDAVLPKVQRDGVIAQASGSADNLKESVGYMGEALLLAIILIFLILSAQFESFVHPLTIMVSLPLSFIGALGALALAGMTMNIFTMIGFIMLMGLVTKNAVLLVDYTNVLRAEGMDRFDALVRAGRVRLRPILMTTAAMIFGMLPVALALSAGGESRAPMATAVIGGLITSTILTLVVVPVVYQTLDALTNRLAFWR